MALRGAIEKAAEGKRSPGRGRLAPRRRTRLRALLGLALALLAATGSWAAQDEIRYFRIGTAATTGTYFLIGGVIANAISKPPGSRDCDRGGSCGVPGLVAIALASQGSVENVEAVASGRIESALAQSDIAYWAYSGMGLFRGKPPAKSLRAIAALFPESVHLVVRAESPIHTLKELRGKRVGLGEKESGTLVDARLILEAGGLTEREVKPEYQRLSQAAEALSQGDLDAFFLFGGYPVPAIAELAATTPIRLVPIPNDVAERLVQKYKFFTRESIPGATYSAIDEATPTIGTPAIWIVNAAVPDGLVHDITKALWRDANRRLLDASHPMGQRIKLATALNGLLLPLHPGAARFYREAGLTLPPETQ